MDNEQLIKKMKNAGYLKSSKIEKALREVKREWFVPHNAYEDFPIEIGYGQTISQPSTVVFMTELLDVQGGKVLEIGAGSGWQAGILGKLAEKVYTIERIPELAELARKNLKKTGIKNVEVICGDGSLGLEKEAPFDRIIITCACLEIPNALKKQLKIGGKLVAPVGRFFQEMVLLEKTEKKFKETRHGCFQFVPLIKK